MKYNTEKEPLLLKEYGRHIHILVEKLCKIENNEERLQKAYEVVKLLKLFSPQYVGIENNDQRIWDMLHLISNFQLNVTAPYPLPKKENFNLYPNKIEYKSPFNKKSLLGKNVNELVKVACATEDETQKDSLIKMISHYIQVAYANWHKKNVGEEVIENDIRTLSKGKLTYTSEKHFTNPPKIRINKSNSSSRKNLHYKKDKRKSY